ncbi:DUF3822 family protein [Flavobacterium agricola]|uniref:DUF3822 family protein n=1 Tax=Flavobacterium agricola TaxID=2870839 RepID=A0ABY6M1A0_9FLAO|nr:DUF3822 family protein [Flavobacterium agricola]UYW02206.1 DUF3822 family protein [Flavobacterium agricola]
MLNQPITAKTYKKLLIKIDAHHLSYAIVDVLTQNIVHLQQVKFTAYANTISVLTEQIKQSLTTLVDLKMVFDEVLVLHNNNYNCFVPGAFFDKNKIESYLQYNTKVFESDDTAYDFLERYDLYNIYVPFTNINNLLLDFWPEINYKNANSVLVQKVLDLSKNKEQNLAFVHYQENHFELVVVNNQKLIFYNSFEHKTTEDFIYYLLFTFEQLKLNPEHIITYFIGNIHKQHTAFLMAYKYIRYVSVYDTQPFVTLNKASKQENLEHFILLHA